MNTRMSCAIAVTALLAACSPRGPNLDTRTFALKYLRGSDAVSILLPYIYTDRPYGKGVFSVSDNAITVRETRDNLDKIARVLAEYDRSRPFVRLTFHLIEADGAATTDPAFDRFDEAMTERQARAFQRGVPGARVVRWAHASHYLFLT